MARRRPSFFDRLLLNLFIPESDPYRPALALCCRPLEKVRHLTGEKKMKEKYVDRLSLLKHQTGGKMGRLIERIIHSTSVFLSSSDRKMFHQQPNSFQIYSSSVTTYPNFIPACPSPAPPPSRSPPNRRPFMLPVVPPTLPSPPTSVWRPTHRQKKKEKLKEGGGGADGEKRREKRKCSSRIQHNTNLAWASGQEKGGKSTRREENTRKGQIGLERGGPCWSRRPLLHIPPRKVALRVVGRGAG